MMSAVYLLVWRHSSFLRGMLNNTVLCSSTSISCFDLFPKGARCIRFSQEPFDFLFAFLHQLRIKVIPIYVLYPCLSCLFWLY